MEKVYRDKPCNGFTPQLMRYSNGKFVKWFCTTHAKGHNLSQAEWEQLVIGVRCPKCDHAAEKTMIGVNYGFECKPCDWRTELGELLPEWP